ncbi:hypothetical protein X742_22260 [Mesorhizobium sp. LNHC232B00]|nr:hypothetical protein X742_22260 [Mesorhizobium sp. LNHC232B00]
MDEGVAQGIGGEIVERPAQQPQIDCVGAGIHGAARIERLFLRRQDEVADSQRDQDDEQGGGQKAPGAAGIEAPEVEPAGLRDLLHQMRGDQPAGNDEEDIDAGEAAG